MNKAEYFPLAYECLSLSTIWAKENIGSCLPCGDASFGKNGRELVSYLGPKKQQLGRLNWILWKYAEHKPS